jgi:hypothetical protein
MSDAVTGFCFHSMIRTGAYVRFFTPAVVRLPLALVIGLLAGAYPTYKITQVNLTDTLQWGKHL